MWYSSLHHGCRLHQGALCPGSVHCFWPTGTQSARCLQVVSPATQAVLCLKGSPGARSNEENMRG